MKILPQFKLTSAKTPKKEPLEPGLDPSKSDYYESSFLGNEDWLDSSGKSRFLGRLAEDDNPAVTFRRQVPDSSRPQNQLVRIGKSLAVGLLSTVVTTAALSPVAGFGGLLLAAAIGTPAFAVAGAALAVAGVASGVEAFQNTYSDQQFKTKPFDLNGSLSWSSDGNDLLFTPEGAKTAVKIPQQEWYVSQGGD